ncbi:MAG: hypothetical protein FJ040_08360 [Chloroflexi bacterium]|nr:hypothetical protein [Chloroflexota bacterium]
MPQTHIGRGAVVLAASVIVLWFGRYLLETWVHTSGIAFPTALTIQLVYAYGTLTIAVISGIMAVVARQWWRDQSVALWMPIGLLGLVLAGVVRSLLFP